MFWFVCNKIGLLWNFRAFCYKKIAISFSVSEYPFLSLIVAKIRVLHVGNKIALLWVLAFLLFFVAKMRSIRLYSTKTMFWFVCCNIGLFSVLLYQKEVFFQYARSHPDFHSILLKQRFCFLLAKLRCLRIVFLRTTLFSVSVTKLHFGRSILLRNMLWFVCRKIVSSDIAPEKCFLPVCIESLWFLLDFTQNRRFCLFSGKLRCFQDSCLEEQPLPFFVHKLRC